MKKYLITLNKVGATLAIMALAYTSPAFSEHGLPFNSWTGSYLGASAGVAFNHVQLKSQQLGFTNQSETCNTSGSFSSFFPAIQMGYAREYNNHLVSGIEINATFNTNQKNKLNCDCAYNTNVYDRFSFKNQLQGSIKGRLGRAIHWKQTSFLPYLTAGISVAKTALTYKNEGGDHDSKNTTPSGWLLGAGIEWTVNTTWSLRAEYAYLDYGKAVKMNLPTVYDLTDPNG